MTLNNRSTSREIADHTRRMIAQDAAGRHADPAHVGRMGEAYPPPEDDPRAPGATGPLLLIALVVIVLGMIGWAVWGATCAGCGL